MILLTTLLLITAGCLDVQAQGKSLDDLIKDVFKVPTSNNPTQGTPTQAPVTSAPPRGNTDTDCTCVPYYLCNNGSINTNGEGIIDIRINDGPCNSYIEVCCSKENTVDQAITPTPPPDTEQPKGCGNRHPEGVGFRITGDKQNEAQFGEFPWMVAILKEQAVEGNPQKLNIYQCGGALIHPAVVLTAAHCVTAQTNFKVRAGEWDTQTTKELYPHQDRDVDSIVIHPQFYAGALYNDVALLFLSTPVTMAENVDIVCLPPQDLVSSDARCYATGWGKDTFGKKGKYQVILKKIDLPVVPNPSCQVSLRKTRLGQFFELHESFICAGGEPNKDTCKGDGGSPLVCSIGGTGYKYYQAGIVAWGIGCGEKLTPGVYVNVAKFRNWIDEQMRTRSLDPSTYQY